MNILPLYLWVLFNNVAQIQTSIESKKLKLYPWEREGIKS